MWSSQIIRTFSWLWWRLVWPKENEEERKQKKNSVVHGIQCYEDHNQCISRIPMSCVRAFIIPCLLIWERERTTTLLNEQENKIERRTLNNRVTAHKTQRSEKKRCAEGDGERGDQMWKLGCCCHYHQRSSWIVSGSRSCGVLLTVMILLVLLLGWLRHDQRRVPSAGRSSTVVRMQRQGQGSTSRSRGQGQFLGGELKDTLGDLCRVQEDRGAGGFVDE